MAAASKHTAPDGRTFTTSERRGCCDPCWQAVCGCGYLLTRHAFTEAEAVSEALDVLGRAMPGHAGCEPRP